MLNLVDSLYRLHPEYMYRRAIMMEQEQRQQEQFISRLGSLPVVSSAWNQACGLYTKTKDSNSLVRATCNLAESSVNTVVSTAKPYVEKYSPQIEKVNAFACEKLALLEEKYPVITKPTDEVIQESKDKCAEVLKPVTNRMNAVKDTYKGMVNYGHETVESAKEATKSRMEAVKDYGMTTVSRGLETPLGRYAMEKMHEALSVSEDYVEKYLPPTEEEEEGEKKGPVEVDEVSTMTRVTSLSTKVRQRMYKRAMKDLKGLQMRSKEKMEKLNFTVDLIEYAKSSAGDVKDTLEEKYETAQAKMAEYWEQINQEEDPECAENPTTFEGKTIVVARRLTRQVKDGVAKVSGYMPARLQPAVVRERLENALKYTEEMYAHFKEAHGFEDLPSWLLEQTKEKMSYIQETISFLTETFLVAPINWIGSQQRSVEAAPGESPRPEGEEIEMEPLH